MNPADYLLPLPAIDWTSALAEWRWLLPANCTPQYATYFGDLFLLYDSDVGLLDLENGTFDQYCDGHTSIPAALDADDDADVLLYAKLVDQLATKFGDLIPGRCYHFKIPTVLDGEFAVSNIGTNTLDERIRFCGDVHRQIKDLPDGASVKLNITEC